MKRSHKAAAGIVAALSLGLAATAFADAGAGHRMQGGMQHGMQGGMQHGKMGGMGGMGDHSLMTPEERTALQGKMRNAATPEERQKIAQAQREEMHKRAQEHKH